MILTKSLMIRSFVVWSAGFNFKLSFDDKIAGQAFEV